MTLFLFDIDGTLMRSGGAGREAMVTAMDRCFGAPDAFDGVSFAGAVDPGIVGEAFARAGVAATPENLRAFRRTYLRALRPLLAQRLGEGRAAPCPGVREAVATVGAASPIGLMTGNWRRGADLKLGLLDLHTPFQGGIGAWGDDAPERDALLPYAWRRARRRGLAPRRIVVIGDTPNDVRAARAGAAALRGPEVVAVVVETGFATREELVASQPDWMFPTMADGLDALVRLAR